MSRRVRQKTSSPPPAELARFPLRVPPLRIAGQKFSAMSEISHPRRLALWSGPRNLSTALMRSFSSRADCVVSDEPFYAAYLAGNNLDHPGRAEVIASQPADWRVVAVQLAAGDPPLPRALWYQKHMAHHMRPEMLGSWLDVLDHAFLIRHPGRVIASYQKVSPGMAISETGLPWQVKLFEHLREVRGDRPRTGCLINC